MEHYKVVKKLGKGAQGAVYLATDLRDGKSCVLKKVECNDEAEANKAFKEAMALEQLSHKYICGYREFFVNWDQADETMYVCIVMEFYETGDLEMVLRQQRAKQEALPEPVLKKWLGQMIEALVFVHAKKIIHRDLKPSNIFMTKELDISIGDFGVATVMNDARTRTRTAVGTMNWMAPEVLERPYDERSDVWSLGCIVLDMASCAFFDHAQSQSALFEIKHSSQRLEEVLKDVGKFYNKDLCQLVRSMLRRKFQQRPTSEELLRLPYVRSCLALTKSSLVEGDQKRAAAASAVKPTTTKRIPDTVAEIFEFMGANADRAGCLVMGMEAVVKLLAKKKQALTAAQMQVILTGMEAASADHFVQTAVCQLLRAVVIDHDNTALVQATGRKLVTPVLMAMRTHAGATALQLEASLLILDLCTEVADMPALIGKEGGAQDVLAVMRDNTDNAEVCTACCRALWSLCVAAENAKIITEEQGVEDVVAALNEHRSNALLVDAACAALWSLSAEDTNVDAMLAMGTLGLMARALVDHRQDARAVAQICTTLASLVVDGEAAAWHRAHPREEVDGVVAVLEALRTHQTSVAVVEPVCMLLQELADHDDVRELLVEKGATEQLVFTKGKFAPNDAVLGLCDSAIEALMGKAS